MRGGTKLGIANIRCPFFRGHTPLEIGCEGITQDTVIRLVFHSKIDLQLHEQIFCCEHFKNCELFDAIHKQYNDQ